MRARTLPLDNWEKWEIKGFCICFGESLERKRERDRESTKKKAPNCLFLKSRGVMGYLYLKSDP